MTTLKGKVALVTGGSRGIGAAIAKRLAREGAAVSITYSVSHEDAKAVVHTIETDGGRGLAIQADNADFDLVKASVAATVKAFGRLDVLVNNAATFHGATILAAIATLFGKVPQWARRADVCHRWIRHGLYEYTP